MNLKTIITLPLLLTLMFVVASCGPDKHHGRVEGKLSGINEATLLAYVDDSIATDHGHIDSVVVKRGKFAYDRPIDAAVILTLVYPNYSTTSLVLEPGKTVKLAGDASRLSEIEISGTDDNNLLNEFRSHTRGKRDVEVRREAATFIRSHAATQAAVVLFRDLFAHAEVIEPNPTKSLLDDLVKAQPAAPALRHMAATLKPLMATAPGAVLPSFTAKDIDGATVSSADYRGKNLLIVFTAQWDGSFFMMKSAARKLRSEVADDRLAFLFVSLDVDKKLLRNAIMYEPLPGRCIYDGKGFSGPLVEKLGMRYVGGSLLVGRDGKIKARDVPYTDWEARIPTLL